MAAIRISVRGAPPRLQDIGPAIGVRHDYALERDQAAAYCERPHWRGLWHGHRWERPRHE